MQQNKLFVGNLAYSVNEEQLSTIFSPYGDIEKIDLILDRFTGESKCIAFITYTKQVGAESALEQNGKTLVGRPLKVNIATEKGKKGKGRRPRR
ncbi:MAG: RNA-binding protein [Methylococcales bacterium]|jgi:RNA recognition motif-containing protein|nr:RNA-binding protein [Methylococcales bacterium]MBT7410079.1 RNA-binding protein [Methylococcales bacterium]